MTQNTMSALQELRNAKDCSWGYGTGIGRMYGPAAAELRQRVASALHGTTLSKSHKLCQYGRLSEALFAACDVIPGCLAVRESEFNRLLTGDPQ